MENESLLKALEEEIDRLRQVRNLLAGVSADANWQPASHTQAAKKHALSPEGRERIANAQRKRWAAHRLGAQEPRRHSPA